MKKRTFLFVLTLVAAMTFVVAACGPSELTSETPGDEPGGVITDTDTITGTTPLPVTEPLTDTDPGAPTSVLTLTEALEMTEPPATELMEATEVMTTTEVLPPTGFVSPNRVTNLLDFAVYNQNGEQIGEVGDLILNAETEEVEYVILELGGFLGLGEAQVPVPWAALEIVAEERDHPEEESDDGTSNQFGDLLNAIVVLADQETLDNAPEVDLSVFDTFCGAASGWDTEVQSYWASLIPMEDEERDATNTPEAETPEATQEPTGTPEAGSATEEAPMTEGMNLQGVILATDLIDANINMQEDALQIGIVDDVMVDVDTGEIRFLIVTFTFDGTNIRLPLPAALLGCDANEETYLVLTDTDTVRNAPAFPNNEFPDTRESGWDSAYEEYWNEHVPTNTP